MFFTNLVAVGLKLLCSNKKDDVQTRAYPIGIGCISLHVVTHDTVYFINM